MSAMSEAETAIVDTVANVKTTDCKRATSEGAGDRSASVTSDDGTIRETRNEEVEKSKSWSAEEDEKLCNALEQQYQAVVDADVKWNDVANVVMGRSAKECESRWQLWISEAESWTEQEDARLREAVLQHGKTQRAWNDAADALQERNWMQCRFRWQEYLQASLKEGPFNDQEERILREAVNTLGERWRDIAELLPGRRPFRIEYHWKRKLRPLLLEKKKNVDLTPDSVTEAKPDCVPEDVAADKTGNERAELVSVASTEACQLRLSATGSVQTDSKSDIPNLSENVDQCLKETASNHQSLVARSPITTTSKAVPTYTTVSEAVTTTVSEAVTTTVLEAVTTTALKAVTTTALKAVTTGVSETEAVTVVKSKATVTSESEMKQTKGSEVPAITATTTTTTTTTTATTTAKVQAVQSSTMIASHDTKKEVQSKEATASTAPIYSDASNSNKIHPATDPKMTASMSNEPPHTAVSAAGDSIVQSQPTPVSSMPSQSSGPKPSVSVTQYSQAISTRPTTSSSSSVRIIPVSQPRHTQSLTTIGTAVPTAVVYSNQGYVVSSTSATKPLPATSLTSIQTTTAGNQKSYGVTTVLTRMPSGQYVVKHSNLVTPQSRDMPKQRPASFSPGTISVVQPGRTLVSVRPATMVNQVVSGSASRTTDQIQVRKIHISCPTALAISQPSHVKLGTLATTPSFSLQPMVQQLAVSIAPPQIPLKMVSGAAASAFSTVVTAPKSAASCTEGTISTSSAAAAQSKKDVTLPNKQQLKSQLPSITSASHSLTLVPTTAPVIFCTATVPSSHGIVQPQQFVSKSVQKSPTITTLTYRQPQVVIHGQKPLPSVIRLESSGATSSVRAALNAASTQQGRESKTGAGISSATTQSVKPAGTNLPPPPALIHTPKENTQKVPKRDVISTSPRWVSNMSSSSQPVTSTPVCKADHSRSPNVLLYKNVGSKKLGNLSLVNITVQSQKSNPGQRKRPDVKRSPLQNDSGLKRVKIVTGKAISSKQSTLTAEDIALMERFSQWGDSASSESDNNRGESQQSIRDDPDFRPSSIRRFKRLQRNSADGESEDDDQPKRRKSDLSDEGSDGGETFDGTSVGEVKSSEGGENQRKRPHHCKHCGSARFFSRGDNIYCTACKRKLKQKVTIFLFIPVSHCS